MDDPFGCYMVLPVEGNVAHYYLPGAGKALCDEPLVDGMVRATGNRLGGIVCPGVRLGRVCASCRRRNEARWLAMYGGGT